MQFDSHHAHSIFIDIFAAYFHHILFMNFHNFFEGDVYIVDIDHKYTHYQYFY